MAGCHQPLKTLQDAACRPLTIMHGSLQDDGELQSTGSGSGERGVYHNACIEDEVVDARQPLQRRRRCPHAGQVRKIQLLHADAALCDEGLRSWTRNHAQVLT
jgi:hypothetical protein